MDKDFNKKAYEDFQVLKESIENIHKTEKAGQGNFAYTYADLIAVKGQTDEAIKEAGFVLVQKSRGTDGIIKRTHHKPLKENKAYIQPPIFDIIEMESKAYEMHSELVHLESGFVFDNDIPLYADDIDPQAMGSSLTYMRRYSLYVLLDIITEDDDGAGASNRAKSGGYKPKNDVVLPETFEEAKKVISEAPNKTAYYGLVKNSKFEYEEKGELTSIIYPK